jgi:hypothetical protein
MSDVVFAGPSLHGVDPRLLDGFDMRPPAGCGDVLGVAMAGADAIGLIDGVFDHALSVWHKEILFAVGRGTRLYGAASMGALRAAECAAYGMIGVGRIFEDYYTGRRSADADVGVAHAPAEFGYAPLSVAMVDVEATLDAVVGILPEEAHSALKLAAQKLHFKERTWPDIVACAGLGGTVTSVLERHARSRKQEDALALLARMRADAGKPAAEAAFTLQRSGFFTTLQNRVEKKMVQGIAPGSVSQPSA